MSRPKSWVVSSWSAATRCGAARPAAPSCGTRSCPSTPACARDRRAGPAGSAGFSTKPVTQPCASTATQPNADASLRGTETVDTVTSASMLAVVLEHVAHVHRVDVVGAEDQHVAGLRVAQQVDVLPDGVGGAAEPGRAQVHRGGHRLDVLVDHVGRQRPPARHVLHQRGGLVLGQHADAPEAAVHQVGQHEVDQPVAAAEVHGGLAALAGERVQPAALAPGQHERQGVAHPALPPSIPGTDDALYMPHGPTCGDRADLTAERAAAS